MNMFRNLTISGIACLLLAFAPAAGAQSPGELRTMQTFLEIMSSYFEIIESSYEISSHAEKAAIFQLQKVQEVYEQRGEKARAVEVFRDVLKQTKNPTIRNAVYMLISDNLKESGRTDEAIEMLRQGLRENIAAAGGK